MAHIQALDSLVFGDVDVGARGASSPNLSFRRVFVDISKLLVERWLKTERGQKFANDVENLDIDNPRERMKEALKLQGIFIASWITPQPDTDTYHGSIECDESKPSLAFTWKIPYQVWPKDAVSKEVLEQWIKECDDWLDSKKWEDPNEDFPRAPNNFIPLATT